jgi:ATP-dependent helicase/nuclease subunit A
MRSPLTQAAETRFMRGNLIHKLLEILPEFEKEKRMTIADKMLLGYKALDPEKRDDIITEVFAVLNAPEFAEIFAPGSRAEISLAGSAKGLPDHLYLNAQIDRISVTDTKVFIVDYKSNRPPPQTQEGVADIYWGQMAAYRELAQEIYPEREIVCALLWTDGPRLMILDDTRLDMALTQIASLPT